MVDTSEKLINKLNDKLDALIILNVFRDLKGDEKLNLLKHSIGLKPVAKILGKDASNLRKFLKDDKKR